MAKLLSDSDSDVDLTINKDYAENYNKWREKEELQKLKDRYGEDAALKASDPSSDSSSDESEDEEGIELTPEFEKGFLKTLSMLKSKDPRIYDKNVTFFSHEGDESKVSPKKSKKEENAPLFLRDYERKVIVEKEGHLEDEEDEEDLQSVEKRPSSPSYIEEQRKLKESFREFLEDSDDDDSEELLKTKQKTKEEKEAEEEEYLQWLKGEKEKLSKDKDLESDLKPLHDYWNNPTLDSAEAFLRDYVLNKHHTTKEEGDGDMAFELNEDQAIDDQEALSEDEKTLEKQAEFEHKYNFRFEEPDQEFIKRFPRTIKDSMRRKDDARKLKREEIRKRKEEEKEQKKEELKRLKALKRKEIMDKIEKLKEITGNNKIGFDNIDLSCDFDPEKYDEQMKKLFDDEYYDQEDDGQRPVFSSDDELDGEDDNYENNDYGDWNEDAYGYEGEYEEELHCEDPDFNMDADYDPSQEAQPSTSKASKKRKKSRFAEVLEKNRDVIDKEKKDLLEAFDEYYKLDYCDMIGDTPVRFRYRNVQPNDFGLTAEEILFAKDRELNQWCSLKKACQYRTEQEELYDVQAFKKKAQNPALKKKIFQSLYEPNHEEGEQPVKKKRRKKKKRASLEGITEVECASTSNTQDVAKTSMSESNKDKTENAEEQPCAVKDAQKVGKRTLSHDEASTSEGTGVTNNSPKKKKKKLNKKKQRTADPNRIEVGGLTTSADRLQAYGINPKKVRNKLIYGAKKPL